MTRTTTNGVRTIARDRRDRLGEGPLWSARENAVYWVDLLERRLNRVSLADDAVASWEMPDVIGWAIEREDAPGFVAGIGRRFVTLMLDPVRISTIAAPEEDRPGNRVNDAKADAAGRIWGGTMPFGCDVPSGNFYRLDPDGTLTRVDSGYTIANGPAIPASGDFLLHTDTAEATIYRYTVRSDGALADRTPFIRFEESWGNPDGMTFDAEGGLWVACWGGGCVRRFTPDGRPDRVIAVPASQVTSCTFAGEGLDRMFVTSAADGVDEPAGGCLFEVDPGVRGLPTPRYRG
jgi:sugar lactone lactonase YvrE